MHQHARQAALPPLPLLRVLLLSYYWLFVVLLVIQFRPSHLQVSEGEHRSPSPPRPASCIGKETPQHIPFLPSSAAEQRATVHRPLTPRSRPTQPKPPYKHIGYRIVQAPFYSGSALCTSVELQTCRNWLLPLHRLPCGASHVWTALHAGRLFPLRDTIRALRFSLFPSLPPPFACSSIAHPLLFWGGKGGGAAAACMVYICARAASFPPHPKPSERHRSILVTPELLLAFVSSRAANRHHRCRDCAALLPFAYACTQLNECRGPQ